MLSLVESSGEIFFRGIRFLRFSRNDNRVVSTISRIDRSFVKLSTYNIEIKLRVLKKGLNHASVWSPFR